MARPDTWMPLYVGDYLADTTDLTTEEHGAYLLLIMHYWRRGGLPDNDQKLSSIARVLPEHWQSIKQAIVGFFSVENGHWIHERIEEELERAKNKYEKRVLAGRRGGIAKAKRKQTPSNASSKNVAMPYQPQPQPQLSKDNTPIPPKGALYSRDFESWWEAWPHKVGKDAAWRVWQKRKDKPALTELLAAIERYKANKPADRAWCNPSTWLNQGRWQDEFESTTGESEPMSEADMWKLRVDRWDKSDKPPNKRYWHHDWGPPPHHPSFKGPREFRRPTDFDPIAEMPTALRRTG